MNNNSGSDLGRLFHATTNLARWRAEAENASARVELASAAEARAYLISQSEPVASLGIDRRALRHLLDFTVHNDINRLERELAQLGQPNAQ